MGLKIPNVDDRNRPKADVRQPNSVCLGKSHSLYFFLVLKAQMDAYYRLILTNHHVRPLIKLKHFIVAVTC